MLTEQERALIKRWNDFAASPRSDIRAFRDSLDKICAELGITSNLPEIGALHQNVAMRPGLMADVAVPKGDGPHPVIVMLHGGGWAAGSLRTHRKLAMHFAENGYLTINADYRLAPENPFPDGFDDCVFAARWASENARRWHGDPSRMALAGDSAGANLAAATLLALSNDPNAPAFRAAVLIYGVFDFPSIIERAPVRAAVEGMARAYLGSNYPSALKDLRVSPLRGIKAGALPPAFVICGTADALLPESRSLAGALKESGIACESHEIDDMPHAFMMIDELAGCREGHRLMFDFLRRRL
jgi:acetyl esterase